MTCLRLAGAGGQRSRAPDVYDIAETTTLVVAVAENLMKDNGLMIGLGIAASEDAVGL
jgi:hypothetical protein